MPTDRELLQQLFDLLKTRKFVAGDETSVRDMVKRYQQPPLTMYFRVVMQLTKADYDRLGKLLDQVNEHLNPAPEETDVHPV